MTGADGGWARGGVPLVRRLIVDDLSRFAITIAGIGFAVVLMLFLLALYEGVRIESNGYIAGRPADAWVTQDNTTNFIKSSSFVRAAIADTLRAVPGVGEVSPILRLITTVDIDARRTTVIVLGIDAESSLGRPEVIEGSDRLGRGEMILDGAVARRFGARVGDSVRAQGQSFRVTGISRGTNAVLTQLAFIPIEDARELLGVRELASFMLVRGDGSGDADSLLRRLEGRVARTNVFAQRVFADNNMQELRGGLLPILATVAVLGGVVALSVLTLLLYGAILERREAYAVLKAIGAADEYLTRLVVMQSLAAVAGGVLFGVLAYLACAPLARRVVPEIVLSLSPTSLTGVAGAALLMGIVGALIPLRRVARIHPAELFRA